MLEIKKGNKISKLSKDLNETKLNIKIKYVIYRSLNKNYQRFLDVDNDKDFQWIRIVSFVVKRKHIELIWSALLLQIFSFIIFVLNH